MQDEMTSLKELICVIKRLRAPDGCSWDRAQTFESLCQHIIEEACELVDAVDSPDSPSKKRHIIEECGDLLLQPLFIAVIAEESGMFCITDVARSITEKLKRRHPHLFAGQGASDSSAEKDWESIKRKEKEMRHEKDMSVLSGLPSKLPPVIKALRLQSKAAAVGFDWPQDSQRPLFDKINEELDEIKEAMQSSPDTLTAEVGDLLFAVINLSRRLGIDPNLAISQTNIKFERRFRRVEKLTEVHGGWSAFGLSDLITFWNQAKKESL